VKQGDILVKQLKKKYLSKLLLKFTLIFLKLGLYI
jgi:hypothetical protein